MSYPLQPYNSNSGPLVNQQFNRPVYGSNNDINGSDLLGSLFGLANQLMGEILRSAPEFCGMSPFMGSDASHPHGKLFGVSAMNVTQITRGPDGRPHVIQAHDERRMGPGGIWQTKKALRDPDRGIEKVQIGYFAGDCGEIIERRLDRAAGQYQQEIQRRGIGPNDLNFSPQWPNQSPLPIRQQPPASFRPNSYYSPHPQRYPFYQQQPQPLLPPYAQQPISALSSYSQRPPQALPGPPSYPYI